MFRHKVLCAYLYYVKVRARLLLSCYAIGQLPPNLVVREYYSTPEDCNVQLRHVSYPPDGVVAVNKQNMDAVKIQSVLPFEEEYGEGLLRSFAGCIVGTLRGVEGLRNSDIVKLRIARQEYSTTLHIADVVLGQDKTAANTVDTIKSLLRIVRFSELVDLGLDGKATNACFIQRRRLIATSMTSRACRLVVNVGTGGHHQGIFTLLHWLL